MIDQNQQPMPDILDRATEALRTAPISESPPPRLVAETIAALQPLVVPSNTPQLQQRRQRMFRVARYSGAAAAILLLAFGAAMFWPWDRGASQAFGQVIENVKKAQSVSFNLTCKFGSQPPIEAKLYMQSGYIRQEMPGKQPTIDAKVPFLIVAVADLHKGEIVQVDYTDKTAQKYPMNEKTKKQFVNPVESISQLAEDDAERIGEENVNGHKTIVYSLRRMQSWIGGGKVGEGESAKVWTDAHSGLPVRMVLEHSQEPNNKISLELTDFVWNSSMPPEIFKLDIPDGFKLSDKPPELGYPAK